MPQANKGRNRKRARSPEHTANNKKLRLDEGTSHALKAKDCIQKLRDVIDKVIINELKPSTYVYTPLAEDNDQEIRILVIEPGEGDDPIKCRLFPSALSKSKKRLKTKAYSFTALSYYWGGGDPIHEITITSYRTPTKRLEKLTADDADRRNVMVRIQKHQDWTEQGTFYVRSNLYAALQRFRKKNRRRSMWIDALCIDQNDHRERARQVAKMHELYMQARKVEIWLGDGTSPYSPSPEPCFRFLRKILDLKNLDSLLQDLEGNQSDMAENIKNWECILGLMRNTWFSRRWVIQELALAREAEVVYGSSKMSWPDFADAIAIFIKNYERIRPFMKMAAAGTVSYVPELSHLDAVKGMGANALVDFTNNVFRRSENKDLRQPMMTLEALVSNLLAFEAKDPKDTIYAVLSLAKDTHRLQTDSSAATKLMGLDPRLRPDYRERKSLLDVYAGFIEYCVAESKSLDILLRHWAATAKKERRLEISSQNSNAEEKLPTWIPLIQKSPYGPPAQRIQGRSNGDSFVGTSFRNSQRNYSATSELLPQVDFEESDIPPNPNTSNRKKVYSGRLFVRGLRIGTIKETTPRAAQGMIFKEALDMAGFDHECWKESHKWSPKNSRVPEGFWRTIVADRGPEGTNPPSWYPRACLECLYHLKENGDLRPNDVIELANAPSLVKSFLERVKDVIWERLFVRVKLDGDQEKYTYGLTPKEAQRGDIIGVLFGCSVPIVFRQQGSGDATYFEVIGECFIYGMMDGEAVAGMTWEHPYSDAEAFELR
ncbi:hypothetical protein BP5796_13252 [Coleophoma crateriformis]|uniref:Heterokaryon incompatibility domain-containing protein n=1 Tax=Coleophoma crateriformis TaxID=565419 RepID=A0A3D8Q2W5_9HELO|nr:hypothetical protein BP5796_13252 [Coleophoma crateriformis]